MTDETQNPSCYKPKCKDCPLKMECEHFKPEVIYSWSTSPNTGEASTYTATTGNPSGSQ